MTNMHDYNNSSSDTASSWTKHGRLITKRIFVGTTKTRQRIVILTLIFVDPEGQQFELQAFNQEEKARSVYRKVRYDNSYKISGRGALRQPNPTYSTSKYYTKIRSWWVHEIPIPMIDDFKVAPYKPINLNEAIKYYIDKGKAVDMIGTFQNLVKGPDKRYINDKPTILGYYVILLDDDSGQKFQVLVWHTPRIDKSNMAIFGAKKGDMILINACRSSYIRKGEPKERQIYTLTSLMQPVVNPAPELIFL